MTPDPTPPGIHPTDAMLLLLGDVGSDADAAALVAELRFDEVSGSLTEDDPFAPVVVAESWRHLGSCDHCSSRRRALLGELTPAIWSSGFDRTSEAASTLDGRVRAAVAELVPTLAALPESLARPQPPRRRWFAGRGAVGSGAASGPGGALARPWIVAIAAAALLLAVGTAFVLRPRTTERSAVGTVPPRVERAEPSDTASGDTSPSPQPESTVVGTEAALAAGAMAPSIPAIDATAAPAPDTLANAAVDRVAPNPAAPEAAGDRAPSLPVQPSPARASSKATAESAGAAGAEVANPVPPQPAKKKTSAPATVASAAAAPPAGSEPPAAGADLGTFADAASALDRFAARAAAPADATAAQLGQQPGVGSANASNTASPAAAPLSAASLPAEPVLCPTVKGSPRLPARIGDRAVLVVRTTDATADVVVDAASCAELARRSIQPTSSTVSG